MQSCIDRKSARGGRALLTGLIRCGRCGRTMRVLYGSQSAHTRRLALHRHWRRADDRAIAAQIVEAISDHAIDAAVQAARQSTRADEEVRHAIGRELEEARYEASLAARRHEAVDPTKRLVARELESRWNAALERFAELEAPSARHDKATSLRPEVNTAALMALAHDLPRVWNAPGTNARTKQRITHILIREVIFALDDATNEAVVTIHWPGGRHTELRVSRVRSGRYPEGRGANPVDAIRKMSGLWPDREIAVTLNRMRCKPADGKAWTTVRVRDMRDQLGVPGASCPPGRGCRLAAKEAVGPRGFHVSPLWTLQRLCFGPDVAAASADREENRDPGTVTTAASKSS
jgi:hypothetical protein